MESTFADLGPRIAATSQIRCMWRICAFAIRVSHISRRWFGYGHINQLCRFLDVCGQAFRGVTWAS